MAKASKDYFCLIWIVSLILCIIPFTSWLFGFITRFKEGHWVCGLIRIFLTFPVIWIIDIICMVLNHRIFRIA